ncbi:Mob1/phocein [Lindgomyces ingoldianus]|uniref:Mob1/phocein n=1 Tax=Lindgomyces ingoldianus TaxID=673940 RepID=A0ACB6R9E8_9PLEO|nr:Mob1/phocein [Lindgomyces ingoldianus]KAF2475801.1 Mob1/phocein [Lindgomyces ingoldianus]
MAASALSPSSSPRLPSPPPIAEDQLGPKSPIAQTEEQQKLWQSVDHGAARRIRPGTKAADMAEGPPLVDLSEIDSAFQLTEHLKALHNFLTHPTGTNTTIPVDRETALKLAQPPENVDKTLWLYELCRFLTQKVNSIIVALFFDTPACSAATCPEMRASEWQYLCAVHDPPKSCCAIDYCCHTLDNAANTLTSPKTFPSRLSLGAEPNVQHQQIRQLTNIFRRVYRIFAHAWFQHREMFWKVEGRTGLYIFFKTVCDVYGLIPEDNYTIPSEAEGIDPAADATPVTAPMVLKRPQDQENTSVIEGVSDHGLSTAGTTKRHRHSPSVGATAVTTVVEENEEEEQQLTTEDPKDLLPQVETPSAISNPAEDSTVIEQPTIGEKGDEAPEVTGSLPAPETAQVPEETEKQSGSATKQDEVEAVEEKASEAPDEPVVAPETENVPAERAEEKAEEETSSAEPEKAKKDEPAVDLDMAGDGNQPGEKLGSDE